MECKVEGCGRLRYAKGLCRIHYQRARKNGDPNRPVRVWKYERPCKEEGCGRPAHSRGWCKAHHHRWVRGKPVEGPLREPLTACSVAGCERPHKAKGLCGTHYHRQQKDTDLSLPIRQRETGERVCKVEDCGRPRASKGNTGGADYCPMHQMRMKRRGSVGGIQRERAPSGEAVWNTPEYRRRFSRLKKYGLTPEEFDAILAAQRGRCAICRSKTPRSARNGTWCVDHDHVTGQVRGLLCTPCNRAVGMLQDDPDILAAALQYVRKHRQMELFSRKAG